MLFSHFKTSLPGCNKCLNNFYGFIINSNDPNQYRCYNNVLEVN